MIRFIAAVDSKLGMADDNGIPWQRSIPTDIAYFRDKTLGSTVLMGYGTYKVTSLLPKRRNVVASSKDTELLPGFELTKDAREFLINATEDIWVIGGPGLFAQTLDLAEELYLTRLAADFKCTKFFPEFMTIFELKSKTTPITENGIKFHFEVWKLKTKNTKS
jgi:dihydrofolate reductase